MNIYLIWPNVLDYGNSLLTGTGNESDNLKKLQSIKKATKLIKSKKNKRNTSSFDLY